MTSQKNSPSQNEKVIAGMMQVLAESYVLYLQTQQFHWNVVGVHFGSLHALFQEQYEELAEAIDGLAEHIRALGVVAPGSFSEFGKLSSLESVASDDAPTQDLEMVALLFEYHSQLLETLQQVMVTAQEVGDEISVDVLVERQRVHSKARWMLGAVLGQ